LRDYARLMNISRYKPVREAKNYLEATEQVVACGYATSPTYRDSLRKIIEQYKLYELDNKYEFNFRGENMKLEVLKRGSRGNQVLWLQEILEIEYGFENEGEFDGIYGVLTENQVKAYQSANRLLVDGVVGKATTIALINKARNPMEWYVKLVIYMSYER